jgi:hypothetical protein
MTPPDDGATLAAFLFAALAAVVFQATYGHCALWRVDAPRAGCAR